MSRCRAAGAPSENAGVHRMRSIEAGPCMSYFSTVWSTGPTASHVMCRWCQALRPEVLRGLSVHVETDEFGINSWTLLVRSNRNFFSHGLPNDPDKSLQPTNMIRTCWQQPIGKPHEPARCNLLEH